MWALADFEHLLLVSSTSGGINKRRTSSSKSSKSSLTSVLENGPSQAARLMGADTNTGAISLYVRIDAKGGKGKREVGDHKGVWANQLGSNFGKKHCTSTQPNTFRGLRDYRLQPPRQE